MNNEFYTIQKEGITLSFSGSETEVYKIHFNDQLKGQIYVKSDRAYFIDDQSQSSDYIRYYKNPNSCIFALHHYLKTGEISHDGYIESIVQ